MEYGDDDPLPKILGENGKMLGYFGYIPIPVTSTRNSINTNIPSFLLLTVIVIICAITDS